MSSTILIAKITGALSIGASLVGGISWALIQKTSNNDADSLLTETFAIANSLSVDDVTNPTALNAEQRNYTCKLSTTEGKNDDSCVVKLITPLSEAKKQINLTGLKKLAGTDPTITQLTTASSYLKVTLKNDFFDLINWNTNTPTIDIYSVASGNIAAKQIGSLKPIFGVKGKIIKGKTLYSVGKVSGFKKDSSDATQVTESVIEKTGSKCLFLNLDLTGKACKAYKLVETDSGNQTNFANLTFVGSLTEESTIKKGSYYLFKFDTETDAAEKSSFKSNNTEISVSLTGNNKEVDKLIISNLTPVFVVGSGSNHFLMLSGDIPVE